MPWLPDPEEKVQAKLFLESRRDWTQWEAEYLLGFGRHSIVGLFSRSKMVKSKHFAREIQYAAVKESDNYHRYLERGQLPEDVMALTKLKPFKCNSIIELHRWSPLPNREDQEEQKYRIYTEYCQYGDLGRLLYRHRRYGYLVEPFLWNMFYHLAKALVVLEHGPKSQSLLRQPIEDEVLHSDETLGDETILEPNQNPTTSAASQSQPVEPWKPIVHNDLKPQNIFLGDEDFDTFSFYPTAKLGDFGNAFLYTPGESQEAVKPGGTASYQAHDDTKGPWSNIHGVGICMFEAVTLEDHIASSVIAKNKQKAKPKDHIASSVKAKNKQKEKAKEGCVKAAGSKSLGSPKAEDSDLFDWRCQGRTPCSRRLELLILRCLERNVKDRITARELLSETRKALSEIRHELEEGYGLDAGPVVNSDGKKESKRLPDDYPFKLSYHGSEIEGTSYGNYVCKFNKRPYLQNDYFPELYTEGLYPMRFPMRDDFKCTMASEDLDHLRMPWETADEWNARERDWPGVEGKYDPSDPFADIDLFELEQPPSDADGAGHEWTTDEETKTVLKNQRNEENRAWATEAKQRKKDNAQVKKKAEMKLREALFARLAERKKRNRGERVSRSPKRRKLVSTSVEAAKSEGKQPEKETEGDEEEEDDGDDEDSEYDDSEDDKSEDDSSGDEDDEDEDGDEDEDDEDEDGDEDEDDD